MPTLAGWFTGEEEPQEVIEQVLTSLEKMLEHNGGSPHRQVQPGAGLVAFADPAYAQPASSDPSLLDWTPDRRTLVYHRPLSGLHPLYYLENWPAPGNLLFASEIKTLLALGAPRRLHLPSLDALWRYGFIPAPWTAFAGIQVVPAGSILRWQHGRTLINPFTDYHLTEPEDDNILDQLYTLLDTASTEILPAHDQLIYLNNGDPYSILATLLATQHHPASLGVATLSYSKSSRANPFVEALSQSILEIKGLDLPEFWLATIEGLETPVVSSRELAAHQLLHTAAIETGARIAISGLGGRALFDNDNVIGNSQNDGDLLKNYQRLLRSSGKSGAPWSLQALQQLREAEPWEETQQARRLARQAARFTDDRARYTYLDLHLRLPDQVVHPLQRLASQEQLALRSPYLTTHALDTLACLPATLPDGTSRKELVTQLTRNFLPPKVNSGSPLKAPTSSLLQMEKHELLQHLLSEQALRETGIFDPAKVAALLTNSQRKSAPRELILVFTTQLLCKMFGLTL